MSQWNRPLSITQLDVLISVLRKGRMMDWTRRLWVNGTDMGIFTDTLQLHPCPTRGGEILKEFERVRPKFGDTEMCPFSSLHIPVVVNLVSSAS